MGLKEIDLSRIEAAVNEILLAIGEDPEREGLKETPRRVAQMYREIVGGATEEAHKIITSSLYKEKHEELVLLRDVQFYSICEHHLIPFIGLAHIGYIPKGQIVGVSSIIRAFSELCRQPQVQERLTWQTADLLFETIKPHGVAVVLEARHLCMEITGINKPGTIVTTSALRGVFHMRQATREEFLRLIRGKDDIL